ncbi:MAG: tRNA (adenosine(37)-N6)-dimethylallyltransferase MiaA [Ruminococcaceae bacterium]|nr:tRNA (adenosine(37)-N6)-dimethylallyltransferase MiaA [Oscillospiraceae bacterium]
MRNNTVVVIFGPTASGKSKLAIDVCKQLNGEVVSADSMQIYRKMDIGTAKALPEEQQGIPHHLIDIIEPNENYSLENFLKDCESTVDDVLSRGKLPVIAGGTGLYISSFINGVELAEAKIDDDYRKTMETIADTEGNLSIKQLLYGIDKQAYLKLKTNDRKRIIRALEVYRATGKTISQNNEDSQGNSKYNFIIFGLNCENRNVLYERINLRVDEMMKNGLEQEARMLYNSDLSDTARQAIGYKELFGYFNGDKSLEQAVEEIKQYSRNYAKRQITWFKKELNVTWIPIDEKNYEEILKNTVNGIVKNANVCYNKE